MGRILRMVCIGGPFGLLTGMFVTMLGGNPIGMVFGIVVGLSFWLFIEGFVVLQGSHYAGPNPFQADERVFEQATAIHLADKKGVRGWLFLTNGRLLFRSLRFDEDAYERSIPLDTILEIQPFRTMYVMPHGLRVVTSHGEDRFVVSANETWVGVISRVKIALARAIWNSVEGDSHAPSGRGAHGQDDRIADHPGKPADAFNWEQIKTGPNERS
jgi:hypothetical protein